MKKQLIACAVTVGLAATVHAGSVQRSVEQSAASKTAMLQSLGGLVGSGKATLSIAKDGVISTTKRLGQSGDSASKVGQSAWTAVKESAVYIVTTPSTEMSAASGDAASTSYEYVIDKSGNVYRLGKNSVLHPIQTSGKASTASKAGVTLVLTEAGEIMTSTGEYVSGKYGEPMTAVRDGSGNVFVASGATLVISGDVASAAGTAVITFVDGTIVESAQESGQVAGEILSVVSEAPGRIFDASKRGRLND